MLQGGDARVPIRRCVYEALAEVDLHSAGTNHFKRTQSLRFALANLFALAAAPDAGNRGNKADRGSRSGAVDRPWTTLAAMIDGHGRPRTCRALRAGLALLFASMSLSGCAGTTAPSFELFGAFFPAWMLCALIGIVGAALTRAAFVGTGVAAVLPYQLMVCTAAGVIAAILTWLIGFGR